MAKKSIDIKAARKLIESKLEENKSRKDILEELSDIYFDKSLIARLIAMTPDYTTKTKYKSLNNILIYLLVLTIIFKIIIGVLALANISIYAIPFALLFPLINTYFAIEVSNFRGHIYNILGVLSLASIFKSLADISMTGVWGMIDILIVSAITVLTF
jgi:hypothetical protein